MRLAYFQAKSRSRHSAGRTRDMSQKLGSVNTTGRRFVYSVEKLSIGATVAYTGKKMNQINKDPGMAMTVYLVQMFVISAALPSTVTRPAE